MSAALIYLRVSTKEQAEKGDSAEGYLLDPGTTRGLPALPRRAGVGGRRRVHRRRGVGPLRRPPQPKKRFCNGSQRATSRRWWGTRSTGWPATSGTTWRSEPRLESTGSSWCW